MKNLKRDLLPERLQKLVVGNYVRIRPMKDLIKVGVQENDILLFLGGATFVISKSAMELIAKGAFVNGSKIAQLMINDKMVDMARNNGADEEFIKTLRMGTLIDIRVDHIELWSARDGK